MQLDGIAEGVRVKITKLGDTSGWSVPRENLANRQVGVVGTIHDFVPGHGGDVWWVWHDEGGLAPYRYDEFEPAA